MSSVSTFHVGAPCPATAGTHIAVVPYHFRGLEESSCHHGCTAGGKQTGTSPKWA